MMTNQAYERVAKNTSDMGNILWTTVYAPLWDIMPGGLPPSLAGDSIRDMRTRVYDRVSGALNFKVHVKVNK